MGAKYGCVSRDELKAALPCASTISRQVRKNAVQKKSEMRDILSDIFIRCPFVAVTCDVWQDNFRRISYLGVTIHYFDSGKLRDQLIAVQPLDWKRKKDHQFIKDMAKKVLEEKGVKFDPKKVIFITDRGSNMKKAFKDFERLNCFPHFLNNVVKESCKIDHVKSTIESCSDLVRYLKISGHNNEFEKPMKSAVPTRFNYVIDMIDSIIFNWEKLNEVLRRENEIDRLDNINVTILNQISSFLKPFKNWSDKTETSKEPSLFLVWIAIDSLIKHCTMNDTDEHLVTLMKVKCICYIEKSFVLHKYHRLAKFLNPNFKSLKFASQSLHGTTINDLRQLLNSMSEVEQPVLNRRTSTSSTSTIDSEMSIYCDEITFEDEVDSYISLNVPVDLSLNPANWWDNKKVDFPKLSKLATAIHAIPASSTPSERGFSQSGAVLTPKRTNLNPECVEDILIIRSDSGKFAGHSIWKW